LFAVSGYIIFVYFIVIKMCNDVEVLEVSLKVAEKAETCRRG
jgi:hypothetical protein